MENLSLVVIARNEEVNIERCFESVKDICNEIIVVDSFSTDKTLEICAKFKAKVFQKEWLGYSLQKNFGNEKATNNYILSLDADEALSEDLKVAIKDIKTKGLKGAYSFNRLNNYCGKWIKHTSWYPDAKMRIWNKNEGKWEGDIHETVILKDTVEIQHLKGDLLHFSYYSVDEHIAQANKFSSIAAESKFKAGVKVGYLKILFSPFFKFIKEYFIKLGFLDGIYGLTISLISSHETFLKYIKLYQKNKQKNNVGRKI